MTLTQITTLKEHDNFKAKAKKVSEKYIMPPKTTDFAIIYAPTEGLYAELSSYRDPKTKELLIPNLIGNLHDWKKIRQIANKYNFDVVQLPYNIIDRRIESKKIINLLH